MDSKNETTTTNRLGIVFFNENMFKATGESDKPFTVLELTPEQQKQIAKMYSKGYSILSIHLYKND